MSQKIITRPTLPEAAKRNQAVDQANVKKYLAIAKTLHARGLIEESSYSIQHPQSGRGQVSQDTRVLILHNY